MTRAAICAVLLAAVAAPPAQGGPVVARVAAGKGAAGKPAKPASTRASARPALKAAPKPPARPAGKPVAQPVSRPAPAKAKASPPATAKASRPSPAKASPATPAKVSRPTPVKASPTAPAKASRPSPASASRPARAVSSRPATAVAARPTPAVAARPTSPPARAGCAKPAAPAAPRVSNEVPRPGPKDPDRERIERLQEALDEVVRGRVLGRFRVGMRVEQLSSGRLLYGWRSNVLMDPASNQKILAAATALLRLGNGFRFRTEVTGTAPDGSGTVDGDLVLRGNGDPSLRSRHLDALVQTLVATGITRVKGGVLGDPRRIGTDEAPGTGRAPLRVGGVPIEIRVRPGARVGGRAVVTVRPASDAFVVVNETETRAKGRARLDVAVTRVGGRIQVKVGGRVSIARGEAIAYRAPPSHPLYAAILLRHALVEAGVVVEGPAGLASTDERTRLSAALPLTGQLLALGQAGSDVAAPLAERDTAEPPALLALHESLPLPLLLRRVNKDSDNEWAERVLEAVGAEVLGGAATNAKGLKVLREAMGDLGLPASAYTPANGSGLGHQNRVTAAGMGELLRRLYYDPRIGPELMQSLSVGGVDGTTRNRFRGTSSAHRVRAKTGTLNGVSCLSGFVGDGADVLAFSILVEGHRKRSVPAVRSAQVSAVNAMMRFARQTVTIPPTDDEASGTDYESGEELDEPRPPAEPH